MKRIEMSLPPITKKKDRLPRFDRVKDPPRMELNGRDHAILKLVYQYRRMTREQIERLLFAPDGGQNHPTKTSRARHRLKMLFHHKYLERIPVQIDPRKWSQLPVYRLAEKGAQLVARDLGLTVSQLEYWGQTDDAEGRMTDVSGLFLRHSLSSNDLRIALNEAAVRKGYQIELWFDDTQLKRRERRAYVTVTAGRREQQVAVIPDAYLVLNVAGQRTHLFLEVDRATMSCSRWKTRILGYLEFLRSSTYRDRLQIESRPRVLTVTTSNQRLENLKATTQQAGAADQFWFTTFAEATTEDILSSPIWRLATDERDSARSVLIG